MDNNYTKLINNLNSLQLSNLAINLDKYLEFISNGEKSIIDSLYELTKLEMKNREERAMNACVKVANFPFLKNF